MGQDKDKTETLSNIVSFQTEPTVQRERERDKKKKAERSREIEREREREREGERERERCLRLLDTHQYSTVALLQSAYLFGLLQFCIDHVLSEVARPTKQ